MRQDIANKRNWSNKLPLMLPLNDTSQYIIIHRNAFSFFLFFFCLMIRCILCSIWFSVLTVLRSTMLFKVSWNPYLQAIWFVCLVSIKFKDFVYTFTRAKMLLWHLNSCLLSNAVANEANHMNLNTLDSNSVKILF